MLEEVQVELLLENLDVRLDVIGKDLDLPSDLSLASNGFTCSRISAWGRRSPQQSDESGHGP